MCNGFGIANFWKAPNEPNKSEEKIRVGNQWGLGTSYLKLVKAYPNWDFGSIFALPFVI